MKEEEYKELFFHEANDIHEEMDKLLIELEKSASDQNIVNAIFRNIHTLKGNAAGMGFKDIANLSHSIEDLFSLIQNGGISLNKDLINSIFKAVDVLGKLIESIKSDQKVAYRGIKTKIDVLIKNNAESPTPKSEPQSSPSSSKSTKKTAGAKRVKKASPSASKRKKSVKEVNKEETKPIEKKEETQITEQAKPEKESNEKAAPQKSIAISDLVQVPVKKLDNLLNLVGELIIEKDRLTAQNSGYSGNNLYSRLNRIASDLQYSVMDVRMVQVGFLFNKFHRIVRDAAELEGKKVNLELSGTDTEIDRNVLQVISDSLIHLIRNAVGHGVESSQTRAKAGKPAEGTLTLSARNENDVVVIDIMDDGAGIDVHSVKEKSIKRGLISPEMAKLMSDQDIIMNIFEPGFSTKESVNAISGRGVGMDVVKRSVESIGGNVFIESQLGQGTKISLYLPSSMAVKGTLLFEVDKVEYAIPLAYTEAVDSIYKSKIHKAGHGLMTTFQDKTISVIFMRDLFAKNGSREKGKLWHSTFDQTHPEKKLDLVVVNHNNKTVGIVVDRLLQQKEIVEKPLSRPVDQVKFLSGTTILGNGNVCLVINVAAIFNFIFRTKISNQLNNLAG